MPPGASEQHPCRALSLYRGPEDHVTRGTRPKRRYTARARVSQLPGQDTADQPAWSPQAVVLGPVSFLVKQISPFPEKLISGHTTNLEKTLTQNKVQ